tara:strand:- start:362 stop:523 length:162 start_codon:yes stop_codon:yes gene_type:complete
MKKINWNQSIYYMSDKEIAQYYCQIWDNIKHMKSYILDLRKKYQLEIEWNGVK